jgi:hypothetical protein
MIQKSLTINKNKIEKSRQIYLTSYLHGCVWWIYLLKSICNRNQHTHKIYWIK